MLKHPSVCVCVCLCVCVCVCVYVCVYVCLYPYDMMNYQVVDGKAREYVAVGTWNNGTLNLHR